MRMLRKIVSNPWLNLAVSLVLIISGTMEALDLKQHPGGYSEIGVHHGIILFGLTQVLKVLPELFEGVEYLEKAAEKAD
ncbi:MAG: hypothetical protein H6510_14110 [Acidobacteria bacterium]|nr:hypothetical protein [Acidobacteriota bacterium]